MIIESWDDRPHRRRTVFVRESVQHEIQSWRCCGHRCDVGSCRNGSALRADRTPSTSSCSSRSSASLRSPLFSLRPPSLKVELKISLVRRVPFCSLLDSSYPRCISSLRFLNGTMVRTFRATFRPAAGVGGGPVCIPLCTADGRLCFALHKLGFVVCSVGFVFSDSDSGTAFSLTIVIAALVAEMVWNGCPIRDQVRPACKRRCRA